MNTNAYSVRQLTPLLASDKPNDAEIRAFIKRAESSINIHLAKRYFVPVEKLVNLSGTISTSKADEDIDPIESPYNIVTGSGTKFLTELSVLDTIHVNKTKEALKIKSITSDTELIVESNACNTSTSSTFFVIPESLVTISEYLTAQLILITHFSEKAYNQETERFNKQFEYFAKDILNVIKNGQFLDSTLRLASDNESLARLGYVGINNDVRTYTDNNLAICQSLDFLK